MAVTFLNMSRIARCVASPGRCMSSITRTDMPTSLCRRSTRNSDKPTRKADPKNRLKEPTQYFEQGDYRLIRSIGSVYWVALLGRFLRFSGNPDPTEKAVA